MSADLKAIQERAEKATPGEWQVHDHGRSRDLMVIRAGDRTISNVWIGSPRGRADVHFIAHARTDIPALLEHIARLNAESARQSEVVRMLTEAFERYAGHDANCEWERDGRCACGFDAAHDAALKAAAEGATK